MKLSSSFADHGTIPRRYTCDGEDLSPPLAWSEVPPGVKGTGYRGPCPPMLSALDTALPDLKRPTRAKLEAAMRRHVLAEATLVGTYPGTRRGT